MKASSIIYVLSFKFSTDCYIRPFCQGVDAGIIDANKMIWLSLSDDPMDILSQLWPREFNIWLRLVTLSSKLIARCLVDVLYHSTKRQNRFRANIISLNSGQDHAIRRNYSIKFYCMM